MQPSWTSAPAPVGNSTDLAYKTQLEAMQLRFELLTRGGDEPVFTTDSSSLWQTYLGAFPKASRQFHNCTSCRRFIETYGGLVVIDASTGKTIPLFWSDNVSVLTEEGSAIEALQRTVRAAKVTGVFHSSEKTWGTPLTGGTRDVKGEWRHFGFKVPSKMVFKHLLLTAGQKMAENTQDYQQVQRALGECRSDHLDQAVELLSGDALYRAEAVLGPAIFLRNLKVLKQRASDLNRANVVWRAVAVAPAGFCHPRSSMIGTLLEDLSSGFPLSNAAARFASKMAPLSYRRPTAAPKEGNIAAAEKIIAQLGASGSLRRRFARLEDLETVWGTRTSAQSYEPAGGFFSHLRRSAKYRNFGTPGDTLDGGYVTWKKFERTVLPSARKIEVKVPRQGHFIALVTAVDPEAPPILHWDNEEQRNPVSWYVYPNGSTATNWNLPMEAWVDAPAITMQPSMWFGAKSAHHGESVILILKGARDLRYYGSGAGLFPQILKSEFHGISSTIEAFSRNATIEGGEDGTACGIRLDDKTGPVRVRVTSVTGIVTEHTIDRFE